jgi:hypothetical protein
MRRLLTALVIAAAVPLAAQAQPAAQPAAQADPAAVLSPTVENCSWLVRREGTLDKDDAPWLRPLDPTYQLQLPTTTGTLEGLYCERDSLVPGEYDDRILKLGIPLFLNSPGGLTTVRFQNKRFQVGFSSGARVTPAIKSAVADLIKRWEARAAAR